MKRAKRHPKSKTAEFRLNYREVRRVYEPKLYNVGLQGLWPYREWLEFKA